MMSVEERNCINEVAQRYIRDAKKLCQQDFIPTQHLFIKKAIQMGDFHDNGRSVALLKLEQAEITSELIYKPRCIKIEKAFECFLKWVNAETNLELKSPRCYPRNGYGWCEYISYKTCQSKKDVSKFYEKLGAWAGLATLLLGTDLHHDNVIAHGDTPYIVDYETFFTPQLNKKDEPHWVVFTAMLPRWRKSSAEKKQVDKSAFSGFFDDKTKSVCHIPSFKNNRINPYDYVNYFIEGFKKIYELFIAHKDILINEFRSPLNVFKNIWTRVVFKDTAQYYNAIRSKHYQGFSIDEVMALKGEDIPVYRVKTTGLSIVSGFSRKVIQRLIKSGYSRVFLHINKYATKYHFQFQLTMIKQCMLAGYLNYKLKKENNVNKKINKNYRIARLHLVDGYWMLVRES